MTEKFGMRCTYGAFGIVVTALFVAALALHAQGQAQQRPTPSAQTQQADVCAGMTQQRCVPEVIHMRRGTVSTGYTVDRTYKSIQIGDPSIVEVLAITDRSFNLHAQAIGRTNIVLFDEMGGAVKNLIIVVDGPLLPPGISVVKIYNLRQFGSQNYECSITGCRLTDQTKYELPAQPYENRNYNYDMTK